MTSIESLENLSNTELRLKCAEYGLPNVPVTDSSRKLLLKRLRDSMTAKDSQIKETGSKTSNRRETIHVSKTTPAAESGHEPLSLSQSTKSRRTLAATAPTIAKDDTPPTSIPISTRRRSIQREPESKPAKAAPASKAKMPTIVIEDDEEDEDDLIIAVENAEKESTASSVAIETIPSRRKSRSVSVPKVIEVPTKPKSRAMTPLVEENIENQKNLAKTTPAVAVSNNNAPSFQPTISTFTQPIAKTPVDIAENLYGLYVQQKQQQQKIPSSQTLPKIGHENTTSRYSLHTNTSTVYSSPSMRYSVGGLGSSLTSYRRKYSASDILNEQSDTDGRNDDVTKSPFLSNFARNLERSKSIGRTSVGDSSGKYIRNTSGMNYDSIRGRRAQNEPTFGQLIQALSRRYKLKPIITVLAILSLSVFGYIWHRSS